MWKAKTIFETAVPFLDIIVNKLCPHDSVFATGRESLSGNAAAPYNGGGRISRRSRAKLTRVHLFVKFRVPISKI